MKEEKKNNQNPEKMMWKNVLPPPVKRFLFWGCFIAAPMVHLLLILLTPKQQKMKQAPVLLNYQVSIPTV